jgi:hypothetical protein
MIKTQAMKKNKQPCLNKRHQKQYQPLVESHIKMNHKLTTASRSALGTAATQAAWRFYAHKDTTLNRLAEPLLCRQPERDRELLQGLCVSGA